MTTTDSHRRAGSAPPPTGSADVVVRAPARPVATRRVSRAERAQASIGVSLLFGTTTISLYDMYLLASFVGT